MSTNERWRPVAGYEGSYEVSDAGRVRSWLMFQGDPGPRIRVAFPSGNGYLQVILSLNGVRSTKSVHQLVTHAFIGPPPEGMQVRHLDGDKANNRLSNLVYGTPSENMFDRVRHGTNHNAAKTHCKRGHPLNETNTYVKKSGWRECRVCHRDRENARRRRFITNAKGGTA